MLLNGEFIAEDEASASPLNRGLMYGDGCFETFRSYSGKFLGWELHVERLTAGLDYLEMDLPVNSTQLQAYIHQLLCKNKLENMGALCRLQCWRKGGRGYAPTSREAEWMAQVSPLSLNDEPMHLITAQTRCISSAALQRRYKLSNGLNYVKAAQEANSSQCDDALMLTIEDFVSETTSANIFWINEGKVYSPSDTCDLLPGTTRHFVLKILRKLKIAIHEGAYPLDELKSAEAAFCTNSLIEIKQVQALDGYEFKVNHPVYLALKNAFELFKQDELKA
jgi:branched-subunit amino acid aminotransferase/4-amino-4-deoxychorismate lyase